MIPGSLAPWPEEFEYEDTLREICPVCHHPRCEDVPCKRPELFEGESTTPGYEGDA